MPARTRITAASARFVYTSFFSSVHYTTAYQGEIVREVFKKRGYKTIGFVVPGTMPHRLVADDHRRTSTG